MGHEATGAAAGEGAVVQGAAQRRLAEGESNGDDNQPEKGRILLGDSVLGARNQVQMWSRPASSLQTDTQKTHANARTSAYSFLR